MALHDMLCKPLMEISTDCNHELRPGRFPQCCIAVPIQMQRLSECTDSALLENFDVSIDMPHIQKVPEILQAEYCSSIGHEGMKNLF